VNNTNRGLGNAAVRVSIALGQDVNLAANTLKEIGASLREDDAFKDGILSDFALWGVDAVDGSTVTLAGQMQCRDTARWGVQREFNRRVVDRFTERGIEIANPQRSFLIVKGGEGELAVALTTDQRGERTITGEPSNLPPERAKPSRT
jgi:small-conductance mechanosensitive channel